MEIERVLNPPTFRIEASMLQTRPTMSTFNPLLDVILVGFNMGYVATITNLHNKSLKRLAKIQGNMEIAETLVIVL